MIFFCSHTMKQSPLAPSLTERKESLYHSSASCILSLYIMRIILVGKRSWGFRRELSWRPHIYDSLWSLCFLWHWFFFFFSSRQLGCEIGPSEPSTVAAAAPTYKPQIIPGRKKNNEWVHMTFIKHQLGSQQVHDKSYHYWVLFVGVTLVYW